MIDKRGQVNTLAPAILALVFAGIVLVFGMVMSQELRDTTKGATSVSVANETIGAFTGSNQTVSGAAICGFGTATSYVVYNSTGDVLVPTDNYTAYSDGNIINVSGSEIHDKWAWQVSYNYNWGDEACVGANATVVGLGTFADFWEIIVLAIVITVVIGLLLIIFGGAGRRR